MHILQTSNQMSTFTLTPRVLKEAKYQATLLSNRISTAWQQNRLKSWTDIEKLFGVSIPDTFKALPWNYNSILTFKTYWINNVEVRLKAATETNVTSAQPKLVISKKVSTFGTFTLFPEQESVFNGIYEAFTNHSIKAALQDGYTGSGKMIIGCAIIAQWIKDGLLDSPECKFRLHPIIVFTPKGVAEQWRRTLEAFGLGELVAKKKICVFNDSSFPFEEGRMFVQEYEDPSTGEVSLVWNPMMTPYFALIDESHRYVNIKSFRAQCIESLITLSRVKCHHLLFMSATPMEKVNDSYLYTLSTQAELLGTKVTPDTFKYFAGLLDSDPAKPNREAMKRLRKVLSPFIFSIPYVKPKHKAINYVQLVEFKDDKDKFIYETAHSRYIEACTKAGKNTMFGAFEQRVALQNYRKTVEPLRAYWIAEKMWQNYKSGLLASAGGFAFKETIVNVAFELTQRGISREQISIIWGGKKEYKTEDLLSRTELDNILKSPDMKVIMSNRVLLRKIKITLRYLQDQLEHSETLETQAFRHNRLKELRLTGKQTDNQRQIEIDKYQSGESLICLFTNASGGIGLSLDCNKPSLLPRQGLFTPVYSGKEFQQVLGRLVRRASIADADQLICMMAGTVEEFHVAPILDEKLKCIAEITNRNFDIVELLQRSAPAAHVEVRSKIQAELDAEVDNTIVSDFVSKETEEEDEEEDLEEMLK